MNNVFNRKSAFTKLLSAWAALSVAVTTSAPAFAAGTPVLGGNSELADLTRVTMDSNTPDAAVFSSTAASGVLDWTRFNIGAGQSMTFDGASTTFFNLVDGAAGKSQIDGIINGNGNVWVINPAGVAFGATSQVYLDGVFAAAAGSVENDAALRAGTAAMPTFSSFDGNVAAAGGSSFTADQVVLMGKTVSAAGDFTGVEDTGICAGSRLVVDKVEGGKISIDVTDFAEDAGNVATLGDIDLTGNLDVKADGDIVIAGSVSLGGTCVNVKSVCGDVTVEKGAKIEATGDGGFFNAISASGEGASGDVVVEGKIEVCGSGKAVALVSAFGGGASGDVKIDGSVDVSGEGSMLNLLSAYGDGASGDVLVGGDVSVGDYLAVCAGNANGGDGSIVVAGSLKAEGNLSTYTALDGDISVTSSGRIRADGDFAELVTSLYGEGGGAITIDGEVSSAGRVYASTGYSGGFAGDIAVNGKIDAATKAIIYAQGHSGSVVGSGTIDVDGGLLDIWSNYGNVALGEATLVSGSAILESYRGTVVADNNNNRFSGEVSSYGRSVDIAGRFGLALGDVTATDGNLKATSFGGKLTVGEDAIVQTWGYDSNLMLYTSVAGDIDVKGIVANYGLSGRTSIYAGSYALPDYNLRGNVNISGSVKGSSLIYVFTQDGDITVANGGMISAMQPDTTIIMVAGSADGGNGGNLVVDGTVFSASEGLSGSGAIYMGTGFGANTSGNVMINGNVITEYKLVVQAGRNDGNGGDIFVNGNVGVVGDLGILASTGNIDVGKNAILRQTSFDGTAIMWAAKDGGVGDVNLDGTLYANGGTLVLAGNGEGALGDVNVAGIVKVRNDAIFTSYDGDVNIRQSASIEATDQGSSLYFHACDPVGTSGSLKIDGNVSVEDGLAVFTTGESLGSLAGDISVSGRVFAGGDHGSVLLYAGKSDGTGGDVRISGGNVESTKSVDIRSGSGGVAVSAGGKVNAFAEDGMVSIVAAERKGTAGDISIDGDIEAGDKIIVIAGYGENANGDLTLSGDVKTMGDSGAITLMSGYRDGSQGDVAVEGSASAASKIDMRTVSGNISLGANSSLRTTASSGNISAVAGMSSGGGNLDAAGLVESAGQNGQIALVAAYGKGAAGSGSVTLSGVAKAAGAGGVVSLVSGDGNGASGDVNVSGTISAGSVVSVRAQDGSVVIGGSIAAKDDEGRISIVAGGMAETGGDVVLGKIASVGASKYVDVIASGDVISEAPSHVAVGNGFAASESMRPVASSEIVNLKVGGDVKGQEYFAVDGKVYGIIDGNASIAAAGGANFQGGSSSGGVTLQDVKTTGDSVRGKRIEGNSFVIPTIDDTPVAGISFSPIVIEGIKIDDITINGMAEDFSMMGDKSSLVVGGNLSIYTAGKLEANGLLVADRDITVSASDFGDVSYLQSGGTLSINNIGSSGSSSPKIAYFESINGVEPKINNLPNDTVIFVDGRLAGGNLNIINEFGSDEAFMVDTPELKSTQGIFGSPTFMHGDLDVANPMEVGVIDYMIQEVPRLTLSSDFPADADQSVEASGLSQRDVYWFGQKSAD